MRIISIYYFIEEMNIKQGDDIMSTMQDVLFHALLGMDRKTFERKGKLMRNPEGLGEQKYCPLCKKPIRINDRGDMTCENFELREDYTDSDKCMWHRWEDGTNYWSNPMEALKAMAKKDPKIAELIKQFEKQNN